MFREYITHLPDGTIIRTEVYTFLEQCIDKFHSLPEHIQVIVQLAFLAWLIYVTVGLLKVIVRCFDV